MIVDGMLGVDQQLDAGQTEGNTEGFHTRG
jgi:hypothetical protein